MTRVDRAIVAALVFALVVVGGVLTWPALSPSSSAALGSPSATPSSTLGPGSDTYREGIVGRPSSVNPFGARSQADRDLVALVFSGLVRVGPSGDVEPDLASDWTVDPGAATYTFHIRPDASWQDGTDVTADDVAFTIHALQDPAYQGPGAGSWNDVTITVVDDHTVRFTLGQPLGGFIYAFTQPIAPQHLLEGVSPADLPGHPFGQQPVGSGPFRLTSFNAGEAILVRAADPGSSASPVPAGSASPLAASASPLPAGSASPAAGGLPIAHIDLRFFSDATDASAAFAAGQLDAVDGLPPRQAAALASRPDVRIVPQQRQTVSAIVLNLRPGDAALRDVQVRRALLEAIDRDALVRDVLGGLGGRADGLVPSGSTVYDPAANPPVAYDRAAAAKLLAKAGWTKVSGAWRAPKSKTAYDLHLVSPDPDSNPTLATLASKVADDWRALGIHVTLEQLPASRLVPERLQSASFVAAVLDLAIGHDPDLYPLLASSQVLAGGTNLGGVQDSNLDRLLVTARQAADPAARQAAYRALEVYLSANEFVLPLVVADDPLVLGNRVLGPLPRTLADESERFGDVLSWRLASDR